MEKYFKDKAKLKNNVKKLICFGLILFVFVMSFVSGFITARNIKTFNTTIKSPIHTINNKLIDNVSSSEYVLNGGYTIYYTNQYVSNPNTNEIVDASTSVSSVDGGTLFYTLSYIYSEGLGTDIIFNYYYLPFSSTFPVGYLAKEFPTYLSDYLFSGSYQWSISNTPLDSNFYNFYIDVALRVLDTNLNVIELRLSPYFFGRDMTGTLDPENSYFITERLRPLEILIDTQDVADIRHYGYISNSQYSIISGLSNKNMVMLPVYEMQKMGFDFYQGTDNSMLNQFYDNGYQDGYQAGLEQYEKENALGPVFTLFSKAARVVFDVMSIEVFSGITLGTIVLFPLIAMLIGWVLKLFFGG